MRTESGLSSSVRCAVQAARHHERLAIVLADMPLMEPGHLSALGSEPIDLGCRLQPYFPTGSDQ
ncbi:MAG: hypothetical protein AB7U35_00480 [Sphingobium sp.]